MKKGFTLIELLAVIVILAIILVIAVPQILKVIERTRLQSYIVNEELLTKATEIYLSQNQIDIQENESITINYQDLVDNKLISIIKDFRSNNECIKSKVTVERIVNDFIYKPGLVCDNYISIDSYDLLKGIGNFETDLSDWDFSSFGTSISNLNVFKDNKSLRIDKTGNNAVIKDNISVSSGDKIYAKVDYKVTTYSTGSAEGLYIYNMGGPINISLTINTSILNNWQRISSIYTAGTNSIGIRYGGYNFNNPLILYFSDDLFLLNLTKIYGAGNEPTKSVMDDIISKSR